MRRVVSDVHIERKKSRGRATAFGRSKSESDVLRREMSWSTRVSGKKFCITPFCKAFDDKMGFKSFGIEEALDTGVGLSTNTSRQCAQLPLFSEKPEYWGIQMSMLTLFWDLVQHDIIGYAGAHYLDFNDDTERCRHVCVTHPCPWDHACAHPRHIEGHEEHGRLSRMQCDMHLIVQRYVKPWTRTIGAGLALAIGAGILSSVEPRSIDATCKATVFISHTWGDIFKHFVTALQTTLHQDTVVWICSFAIHQHGDVAGALSDVTSCPFAVAMKASVRVLMVMDETAATLKRVWCVLEAHLANEYGKNYDMCLPNDSDVESWKHVDQVLQSLDVRHCDATREQDKRDILAYAEAGAGGLPGLNAVVHRISEEAKRRAEIMSDVVRGDVAELKKLSMHVLRTWRSVCGRSVTHVLAACSHSAAVIGIAELLDGAHLSVVDDDGLVPLSVAAKHGAYPVVAALITMKAEVDSAVPACVATRAGLTPLHFASSSGHVEVVRLLLEFRASLEVRGSYRGVSGHLPMTVAAFEGHAGAIRSLLQGRADVEALRPDGYGALHFTADRGYIEAAAALLCGKANADLREAGAQRRTPLMVACKHGRADIVMMLLGAQANVALEDSLGRSAWWYCDFCCKHEDSHSAQTTQDLLLRSLTPELAPVIESFRATDEDKCGVLPRRHIMKMIARLGFSAAQVDDALLDIQTMMPDDEYDVEYVDYVAFLRWLYSRPHIDRLGHHSNAS